MSDKKSTTSSKNKGNGNKVGRKDVWEKTIKPNLSKIEEWYKAGLTEKEIIEALKIGKSSFYKYKAEKTELANLEKYSREPLVEEIKNALYKRAIGYDYEETKTYYRKPRGASEDQAEFIYTEKHKKHQAADTTAGLILLKHWDKKEKWTGDPQTLEMKEKQFRLETMKTIQDKWIDKVDETDFEKVIDILEGRNGDIKLDNE